MNPDELRDRIAETLAEHDDPGYQERGDTPTRWEWLEYQNAAQAVIDDLGLRIDWVDEARGKAGIGGIMEVGK